MAADVLAPGVARSSTIMEQSMQDEGVLVLSSTRKHLNYLRHYPSVGCENICLYFLK